MNISATSIAMPGFSGYFFADGKKNIFLPFLVVILYLSIFQNSNAQHNQLASTPPMGWMTWNQFGPDISKDLIIEMADAIIESGMAAAGYKYLIIDDLWQGKRDSDGILQPDLKKFPGGLKALADSIHSRGLKLGIYSDAAHQTCGGAVGSYGFEKIDAQTYANWGIDYLKYDYCNAPVEIDSAMVRYKRMADALNSSGRKIIFAICEWGQREPWKWGAQVGGQLWRTTWDIRDTWKSNKYDSGHAGIINVLEKQVGLEKYSGPGRWNDPDMLVVGLNGKGKSSSHGGANGCTIEEYRSQMSLWCLLNAPLIASNDLRNMDDTIKSILTNSEAIAINQDPLGKQASRVFSRSGTECWFKPLADGSVALGILNRNQHAKKIVVSLNDIGLKGQQMIRDLWLHQSLGFFSGVIETTVPGHGVQLLKLTPVK